MLVPCQVSLATIVACRRDFLTGGHSTPSPADHCTAPGIDSVLAAGFTQTIAIASDFTVTLHAAALQPTVLDPSLPADAPTTDLSAANEVW